MTAKLEHKLQNKEEKQISVVDKKFKVEKVVYYNSQSLWGVLGLTPIDSLEGNEVNLLNKYGTVSACGSFPKPYQNAEVLISGDIIDNNQYGKQISIQKLEIVQDTSSKEGVINFLAKSEIEGIGVQLAEKIYETFGDDTIEIVTNSPDRLLEIYGIGKKTVNKVKESLDFLKAHRETVRFLTGLGISYRIVMKLIEEFQEEAEEIIRKNPYEILEVARDMTFKQVDEIFLKAGGDSLSPVRLQTAFLHALRQQAIMDGSTGCLRDSLSRKFYSLVDIAGSEDYFGSTMEQLEKEGKIVLGSGIYIYYKEYLDIEKSIAEKLKSLQKAYMPSKKIKDDIVKEEIDNFPFELNEQQVKAVHDCLNTNVAVLTAEAGCGKTTITKALYRIYSRCGFNVELLSPTAKACRRLEECTGGSAHTIHKFLKMTKDGDSLVFDNYVKDTVLIVDEASMMDITLFNNLLKGASLSTRILLVGDNNQLPSVQAGNVLGDVINSGTVHVSLLTDIMRQQEDSSIIKYCSMINSGELFDPVENKDFLYEEFGEGSDLKEKFFALYKKEIEDVGLAEVQVIAPYKKGELGMNNLNKMLQESINAKGVETLNGFRIGDKVRHTQNNYKKEVFNGETGVVRSYDKEEDELVVDYGDRDVTYNHLDIDELMLCYCSTVHASQGSEYKVVFVILDDTAVNSFLHIRRLLYTAVSRGKQRVYILTKPYLVDHCINNDSYRPRITKLKDFLK